MAEKLLITAGDVIDVQLTSETVVIEGPQGRRPSEEPGHIRNRMRLFVRETNGREQKYDFDDTELGVRETQRVAIVRGRLKRVPEPANLILFNLSSGEKDTFEGGLSAYLGHKPFFGAPWKAAFFSIGIAVIWWLVSHYLYNVGPIWSATYGIFFGFLMYPVIWWISATWDRITERMRYRAARKKFIKQMEGRVKAYAFGDAAAGAAPAVEAAPEPAPEAQAEEPAPQNPTPGASPA